MIKWEIWLRGRAGRRTEKRTKSSRNNQIKENIWEAFNRPLSAKIINKIIVYFILLEMEIWSRARGDKEKGE